MNHVFDILIKELERDELDSIANLFNEHQNDPFTYLADIHLFRIFSQLKPFRGFVAKTNGRVIGCIYGLRYLYGCGWIGGLFVHKDFRRIGIGRRLLSAVLDSLGPGYNYLFVDPQNIAARSLVEAMGFKAVYRRLNYVVQTPLAGFEGVPNEMTYDVEWSDLNKATGFKERGRVISMGYYPIKVTKNTFEDLSRRRKISKYGSILTIIENSYCINAKEDEFAFNDYILKDISNILPKKSIVEVNPFYTKLEPNDLAKLINHLTGQGEVHLWTYEKDPLITTLPLKGSLGGVLMELHRY